MKKVFEVVTLVSLFTLGSAFAQSDSVHVKEDDESGKKENQVIDTTQANLKEDIENLQGKFAGLEESYLDTKSNVDKLKKIKISGYIQAQMRVATDTTGLLNTSYGNNYDIGEFQGGKLPAAAKTVFQLRRARVKVAYENDLSQFAIQLDCLPFTTGSAASSVTQDTAKKVTTKSSAFLSGGGISLKDAYFRFQDPWLKSIALKAGIFDRPFGYEISYSSSTRESPERSRIFQTLFPGERDMGITLEYAASDNLPDAARLFNFKGGWFAGNGINIEFDDMRDFIGRAGFSIPFNDINMSIDGGVSAYIGSVLNRTDSLYTYDDGEKIGKAGHKRDKEKRDYVGFDAQLYYGNIPVLGGLTVRGEFINGVQPGTSSTSVSQKSDQAVSSAIYSRKVKGYYLMGVLNIDPVKCQLVGKYDVLDPNKDLSGAQVSSTADMKVSTIGTGLVYHWNENIKLMAYYDMVKNEKISSKSIYAKDVNDNVFTLRLQYKF
ncbi:MAG TPA: hypothetical protein VHO70_14355 [Chitinispirillaceae bacterium]|nr:hypothetical protein [Chitinispirillaceae bacterium]